MLGWIVGAGISSCNYRHYLLSLRMLYRISRSIYLTYIICNSYFNINIKVDKPQKFVILVE